MLKKLKEWWKKRKIEKKTVAHIKYLVDEDDQIYIDYKWNKKLDKEAVNVFSMLFFNINSGKMSDDSISFIQQNCAENGLTEEFEILCKQITIAKINCKPQLVEKKHMKKIIEAIKMYGKY